MTHAIASSAQVTTDDWTRKVHELSGKPFAIPPSLCSDERGSGQVEVTCGACAENGFSIETSVVAALCIVLYRYTGETECIVATPGGLLQLSVDEASAISKLLDTVQAQIVAAARTGPVAVEAIAQLPGVSRRDVQALWRIQFDCSSDRDGAVSLHAFAQPPALLRVTLSAAGPAATLRFTFDTSKYPHWFGAQFAEHVAGMTRQLVDPGKPIAALALLSGAERERIVGTFNATADARVAAAATLHGFVEMQAALHPRAVALVHEGREVTYEELNGRANQLARHLRKSLAVRSGDRVGILLQRSELAIIGLLGALKAGAAYVPLDPAYPWQRLRYMLENADIGVLMLDSNCIGLASAFAGKLLVLDIELQALEEEAGNLSVEAGADSLAYVIYTSGSTGQPKGVAVSHRAIVNTVGWRMSFYGFTAQEVGLQLPALSFDSSVVDIFSVLASGGRLVIPREERRLDAAYLCELIRAHGITTLIATPSYYRLLLTELSVQPTRLRCVTVAGETVSRDLVAAHSQALPGTALINEYGPTENAVCSSAAPLSVTDACISIGRPIANVQAFVLDERRRVCPVGVPGELYLGGRGLAQGYVNRPQWTAECFVAHPVAEWQPGSVYRSGDRARWWPNGTLEFLGRIDNQVKVRGVRIEMDEIEAAILRHASVSGAAVVCKESAQGEKYLAAYVVQRLGATPATLREHLREVLPKGAIPDAIVSIDALPMTVNGKIDRALLQRMPVLVQRAADADCSTTTEARLRRVFSDVLERPAIDVDENFFDAGGHSLRVMELLSRIRSELGCQVQLLDIYAFPTVRELAQRLAANR